MWLTSWLRNRQRSNPSERLRRHGTAHPQTIFRPRLEVLEDRWLPAQIGLTVSSLADSGPGILRAAILTASAGSHSDQFTIGPDDDVAGLESTGGLRRFAPAPLGFPSETPRTPGLWS